LCKNASNKKEEEIETARSNIGTAYTTWPYRLVICDKRSHGLDYKIHDGTGHVNSGVVTGLPTLRPQFNPRVMQV